MADIQAGHRVLEPQAGLGRLLREIERKSPGEIVAVEQSSDCCGVLFEEFPDVKLYQGDFLEREDLGLFDRIVMNPPFKMRRDIKHIRHALTMLKPGGKLTSLCLDTRHRSEAFKDMASTWQEVPAGTFNSEGTGVATVLFSISV